MTTQPASSNVRRLLIALALLGFALLAYGPGQLWDKLNVARDPYVIIGVQRAYIMQHNQRVMYIQAAMGRWNRITEESVNQALDELIEYGRKEKPFSLRVVLHEREDKCGHGGVPIAMATFDPVSDPAGEARPRHADEPFVHRVRKTITWIPGKSEAPKFKGGYPDGCVRGEQGTFGQAPPYEAVMATPVLPKDVTLSRSDLMNLDTYGGGFGRPHGRVVARREVANGVEFDVSLPGGTAGATTVMFVSSDYGGTRSLVRTDLSAFDRLGLEFTLLAINGERAYEGDLVVGAGPVLNSRAELSALRTGPEAERTRVVYKSFNKREAVARDIGWSATIHRAAPGGLGGTGGEPPSTVTLRVAPAAGAAELPTVRIERNEVTLSSDQIFRLDQLETDAPGASMVDRRRVENGVEFDIRFRSNADPGRRARVVSSIGADDLGLSWLDVRGYDALSLRFTLVAVQGLRAGSGGVGVGTYTSSGHQLGLVEYGTGMRQSAISPMEVYGNFLANVGFNVGLLEEHKWDTGGATVTLRVEPVAGVPVLQVKHVRAVTLSDTALMALDCGDGSTLAVEREDVEGPGVKFTLSKGAEENRAGVNCSLVVDPGTELGGELAAADAFGLRYTLLAVDRENVNDAKGSFFYGAFADKTTIRDGIYLKDALRSASSSIELPSDFERLGTYVGFWNGGATTASVLIEPARGAEIVPSTVRRDDGG